MKTTLRMTTLNLVAAVVLAACGTNTPDVAMTSGEISSRAGKPGAPVSLAYRLPAAPEVGAACNITLTVTLDSAVDEAVISVAKSEGFAIVDAPRLTLGAQPAGAQHELTISVVPDARGLRFVNVFADTVRGGQKRRRSFAVPVAGGGDQTRQKSGGKMQETPGGEKVISLPAEEGG